MKYETSKGTLRILHGRIILAGAIIGSYGVHHVSKYITTVYGKTQVVDRLGLNVKQAVERGSL